MVAGILRLVPKHYILQYIVVLPSHFPKFNKPDTGCRGCNEIFSFDKILHPPIEGLCLKYAATINSSVLSATCFSIHEVPAQSCSNAQTCRSTCSSRFVGKTKTQALLISYLEVLSFDTCLSNLALMKGLYYPSKRASPLISNEFLLRVLSHLLYNRDRAIKRQCPLPCWNIHTSSSPQSSRYTMCNAHLSFPKHLHCSYYKLIIQGHEN